MIEGLSGAGKTTFSKEFLRRNPFISRYPAPNLGYMNTHYGRATQEHPEEVYEHYRQVLRHANGERLLLDRWILSNLVYANVCHNQVSMGSAFGGKLMGEVRDIYGSDYRTLIFVARSDVLDGRNVGRNREEFSPFQDRLLEFYRGFYNDSGPRKLFQSRLIDTSYGTPEETFELVIQCLENEMEKNDG